MGAAAPCQSPFSDGPGTGRHPAASPGECGTPPIAPQKNLQSGTLCQEGSLTVVCFSANSIDVSVTSEIFFLEAAHPWLFIYEKRQKTPRPAAASRLHPGYNADEPARAQLPWIPANGVGMQDRERSSNTNNPLSPLPKFYKAHTHTHTRFLERALKHPFRASSLKHFQKKNLN